MGGIKGKGYLHIFEKKNPVILVFSQKSNALEEENNTPYWKS